MVLPKIVLPKVYSMPPEELQIFGLAGNLKKTSRPFKDDVYY
jgi:hypothetical protein